MLHNFFPFLFSKERYFFYWSLNLSGFFLIWNMLFIDKKKITKIFSPKFLFLTSVVLFLLSDLKPTQYLTLLSATWDSFWVYPLYLDLFFCFISCCTYLLFRILVVAYFLEHPFTFLFLSSWRALWIPF